MAGTLLELSRNERLSAGISKMWSFVHAGCRWTGFVLSNSVMSFRFPFNGRVVNGLNDLGGMQCTV